MNNANVVMLEILALAAFVLLPAAAFLGPYVARYQDRRDTRTLEDGSTYIKPVRSRGGGWDGGVGDAGGDGGCGGGDGGGCS